MAAQETTTTAAHWRFIVDTADGAKASKIATRLASHLVQAGSDQVAILGTTLHPKLEGKSEVCIRVDIESSDPAEVVFKVLQVAGTLGNQWTTAGPHVHDAGRWEIDAIASTGFGFVGLSWASVTVLSRPT